MKLRSLFNALFKNIAEMKKIKIKSWITIWYQKIHYYIWIFVNKPIPQGKGKKNIYNLSLKSIYISQKHLLSYVNQENISFSLSISWKAKRSKPCVTGKALFVYVYCHIKRLRSLTSFSMGQSSLRKKQTFFIIF